MTGTNLRGTTIISMIVPTNHADTYATHDSFYGKGGWREVNTLAERNEIPEERRRIGMVVYVRETFKAYLLKNSLSNAGWVPFNIDGEEYVTKEEFAGAMAEALENYPTKTEVQELLVSGGYATQSWVSDYIDGRLTNYQRKTDNTLQTENKTIVGAINEVKTNLGNKSDTNHTHSQYITSSSIPTSLPANGGNANTVGGYTIWVGTQAEYDAIGSKSSTTIYFIKG